MGQFLDDEGGQAVVEYILMVVVAIFLVGIIATGFRRGLLSMWGMISRDVSAACPGCPPDPQVRFK